LQLTVKRADDSSGNVQIRIELPSSTKRFLDEDFRETIGKILGHNSSLRKSYQNFNAGVGALPTNQSEFRMMHGYYEARMKVEAVLGSWPAFWLTAANDQPIYGGEWPPEFDILEITAGNSFGGGASIVLCGVEPHGSGVSIDGVAWDEAGHLGTAGVSRLHSAPVLHARRRRARAGLGGDHHSGLRPGRGRDRLGHGKA